MDHLRKLKVAVVEKQEVETLRRKLQVRQTQHHAIGVW